jgi:hypothetical protein
MNYKNNNNNNKKHYVLNIVVSLSFIPLKEHGFSKDYLEPSGLDYIPLLVSQSVSGIILLTFFIQLLVGFIGSCF